MVDTVDSARTLSLLSQRLVLAGAEGVYVCASHGLFTDQAVELIEQSPIRQVVISDSMELSPQAQMSPKIAQVRLAPMLAKIVESDGTRHTMDYSDNAEDDADEFELE